MQQPLYPEEDSSENSSNRAILQRAAQLPSLDTLAGLESTRYLGKWLLIGSIIGHYRRTRRCRLHRSNRARFPYLSGSDGWLHSAAASSVRGCPSWGLWLALDASNCHRARRVALRPDRLSIRAFSGRAWHRCGHRCHRASRWADGPQGAAGQTGGLGDHDRQWRIRRPRRPGRADFDGFRLAPIGQAQPLAGGSAYRRQCRIRRWNRIDLPCPTRGRLDVGRDSVFARYRGRSAGSQHDRRHCRVQRLWRDRGFRADLRAADWNRFSRSDDPGLLCAAWRPGRAHGHPLCQVLLRNDFRFSQAEPAYLDQAGDRRPAASVCWDSSSGVRSGRDTAGFRSA